MEPQQEALWYCAFSRWCPCFFFPVLPLSTIASTIHYCDPRLKVRMAPERQDKDKHTHAEVRFEHHREGQEYLRRVRALHPRVAGRLARWWLRAREGSDRAAGLV